MLDKQFKIFSFILLLFMIICYLYSDNNSMFFRGGNLDTVLTEKKSVLEKAERDVNKAQIDFNSLGDDSPDPNNYGEALNTALTAKNLAQTDVDIAGQNINKCLIDLKEVYNASDILKDLKERITSCGDNVLFTNSLEAEIELSEAEDKIAADNALIEAERVEAQRIADRAVADQLATKNAEEAEKLAEEKLAEEKLEAIEKLETEAVKKAAADTTAADTTGADTTGAAADTTEAAAADTTGADTTGAAADTTGADTTGADTTGADTTGAAAATQVATPAATQVATPAATPAVTPAATPGPAVSTPALGTTGGQYDISGFSNRKQYAQF